jgi:hypothetical protein
MNVKFSEAEAALIDAARGGTDRGAWLRDAALTALGIPESRTVSIGGIEIPVVVSDSQPAGTLTAVSTWREDGKLKVSAASASGITPDEPAPKPRAKHPCEHRVKPGSYCRSCERLI